MMWEDRSIHWSICNTRYFNVADNCFRSGDVEICGREVVAISPPGSARSQLTIDDGNMICVPGLTGDLVVDHGDRQFDCAAYVRDALLGGVTTVSIATERHAEIAPTLRRLGVRAEIYCARRDQALGCHSGANADNLAKVIDAYRADVRALEQERIRISPAITSQLSVSSRLTIKLHEIAKANGKRLLVNVDSGRPHYDVFRDVYSCSGTMLLRTLNVLDSSTTAILDASATRRDVDILVDSDAGVGVMDVPAMMAARKGELNLKRVVRAQRGALMCRNVIPFATSDDVSDIHSAFGWTSLETVNGIADVIVKMMTGAGSAALGLQAVGRIAQGSSADLLLYESQKLPGWAAMSDDHLLLDLIAAKRPRFVVTDGQWRVRNYALSER
ncbi:amidohydrolase family protein [Paraburkholderia strydomiana]|uniref:amidohydrolase family protein n=1 Tax=Paraburkholderia strydomiana TaxID=1245417 RepID=UPI0038B9335F